MSNNPRVRALRHPYTGDIVAYLDDFPEGPGQQAADAGEKLTEWGQLAAGKTLGKSVNLNFQNVFVPSPSTPLTSDKLNMFTLQADDSDALQLSICLAPPKVYGQTFTSDQIQNASGSQGNRDVAPAAGIIWADALVSLEWGIGGVNVQADCDIGNGLHLTVSASFIRIYAQLQALPGVTNGAYQLAAFVGPGRPRDNNAQRTLFIGSTAINVESAVQPTPNFAKSVSLAGANAAHDLFVGTIRFYRDASGTQPVADYFFSGNQPGTMPVPNGGFYWTIVPGVAVNNFIRAIFQLSI